MMRGILTALVLAGAVSCAPPRDLGHAGQSGDAGEKFQPDRVLYQPRREATREAPGWFAALAPLGGEPAARLRALVAQLRFAIQRGEATPRAREFADRAFGAAGDFDLAGLYERLPDSSAGRSRQIAFAGRPIGDRFVFDVTEGDDSRGGSAPLFKNPAELPPGHGALDVSVEVEPAFWRDIPTYRARARFRVDTLEIEGPAFARTLEAAFAMLADPPGAGQARLADPDLVGDLGSEDLAALGSLQASFPRALERYLTLFRLEDFVQSGGVALDQVRGPGFARNFPALERSLARLGDLFDLEIAMGDMRLAIASEQGRLAIRIPTPDSGQKLHARGLATLHVHAAGLTVRIADLPFEFVRTTGPDWIAFEVVLDRMPRDIEIEGRILELVELSLIETLSGIDLERAIADFLSVLLRGNDGRGTRLAVRWGSVLEVSLETELAANKTVSTGARIYRSRYAPDPEAGGELRELAAVLLAGLESDLDAFLK